ncbi:ATP-binding protein [Myxococcus sp. RHSTA-1-4]|uniref:ATP-binding protein n=1 Tax=Myxococcus sp. RHSTA-1-4 TaxID=2874601 RepID=UPI001CC1B2E5|nr:ATP-binding protein [Myxococcus sp. RHSTA-1-4]MBZ4416001.1 ATP-binding protein [Myxococcus sp. RHSTA-1-4]
MESLSTWDSIGTIVGDASTSEFSFILKSFRSRVGDLVAVPMEIPNEDYTDRSNIIAWGRITSIDRYNPFFPYEAAQELANESISLVDTVLSNSRDQLQARVLVLGFTWAEETGRLDLFPLTYPIPPAADVRYPPAEAIRELLAGGLEGQTQLPIGTLIARSDVPVAISAERVVARHMAILAMTGGGKAVAARRILRELIDQGYPLVIFDPHGDYIGLWEKRDLFPDTQVRLFYPHLVMAEENRAIVETLIAKMTEGLTEPQFEFMHAVMAQEAPEAGESVIGYIRRLLGHVERQIGSQSANSGPHRRPTMLATRRALNLVVAQLAKMESSNKRLRQLHPSLKFEQLPDPHEQPEEIVAPSQVSILYLGGYDHLTQSTIVSLLMEALFAHRAELSDRIAPFLSVVEEAHNFIPSGREGTDDTPSLATLRKVVTEGRKFGVGLMLVTQRPSRVDETILAQCNSFLVLRLVNPKDQAFVRSVMENLSESDARMLPGFGPGQGLISGQAVRFPLLVRIKFDKDLLSSRTQDEDFIRQAAQWKPDGKANVRKRVAAAADKLTRFKRGKRRKPN